MVHLILHLLSTQATLGDEILPQALLIWDLPYTARGYGLVRGCYYLCQRVCVLPLFRIPLLCQAKDILLLVLPSTSGMGSSAFLLHKLLGSPRRFGSPTEMGRCQQFLLRSIRKAILAQQMKEVTTSPQLIRTIL